ncbi:hypothetical protein HK101_011051 [Irineochytrium annulatum]|nr:hypothetical protein HK101_011051 [Irineochytrium annulatum]
MPGLLLLTPPPTRTRDLQLASSLLAELEVELNEIREAQAVLDGRLAELEGTVLAGDLERGRFLRERLEPLVQGHLAARERTSQLTVRLRTMEEELLDIRKRDAEEGAEAGGREE